MSTDIVRFEIDETGSHEMYQGKALRLFLAISLPMTAVTFICWYGFYKYSKKRSQVKESTA